nr:MAG TPA: hypothetical protein [Caudoviricetes sp.]
MSRARRPGATAAGHVIFLQMPKRRGGYSKSITNEMWKQKWQFRRG